ncbi:MAG TPA: hypothetical protein VH105_00155, partial [Burkholderiales bacterium]|nr:hypothetical protein [Burkholderiales bacterium]
RAVPGPEKIKAMNGGRAAGGEDGFSEKPQVLSGCRPQVCLPGLSFSEKPMVFSGYGVTEPVRLRNVRPGGGMRLLLQLFWHLDADSGQARAIALILCFRTGTAYASRVLSLHFPSFP